MKDEWRNIESSKDELDGSFVIDEICSLEKTYINCHAYLADTLLSEVYTNNNSQSEFFLLVKINFACLTHLIISSQWLVYLLHSTVHGHIKTLFCFNN